MSGFSAFVLTTGNILFRWKLPVQLSIFVPLAGDNSLVHDLRMMAAVELHLNTTYAQHIGLKSAYEKSQYVTGGKLFSSRTVFEVVQGF